MGGSLIYYNRKELAVKPLHLMARRLETRQGLVRDLKRGRVWPSYQRAWEGQNNQTNTKKSQHDHPFEVGVCGPPL